MADAAEGGHSYLVEHYWPGVTADTFRTAADRVRACAAELTSEGAKIEFLHSTFVPEDEAAYCVFRATSPTLVEEAYRRAGVPFERMVDAFEMPASGRPA